MSALVGGMPVWFETADAHLEPSAEAFAGAFLIPALHRQARLSVDSPLDAVWVENTRKLVPIYAGWWGYPDEYPVSAPLPEAHAGNGSAPGVGLCFSGGIDSFFSLLRGGHDLDVLVYVDGYDLRVDRARCTRRFEAAFRELAGRMGMGAVILRTNLKRHYLGRAVGWSRTHGAALAAAGHLLRGVIGRTIIGSSFRYTEDTPWGTHWTTDPLWSSSLVTIVHDDATLNRDAKVAELAAEPVLWEHLTVCPDHPSELANCSRCEKCVRTMVLLAEVHQLDNFRVFDRQTPVARLIDGLPRIPRHSVSTWRHLVANARQPGVRPAVRRLLRRTKVRAAIWRPRLIGRVGRIILRRAQRPRRAPR